MEVASSRLLSCCRAIRLAWWLFGIWAAVGTVVLVVDLKVPGGGLADAVFLALGAAVVLAETARSVGARRAWVAFGWVAVGSGVIETIGATTGWPFGRYAYTDALGPRLGVLPLAIPAAWWLIVQPLRAVLAGRGVPAWIRPFLVAVGAVSIDLVIEPVATVLRGYWLWQDTGPWHGVPTVNFAGWFGTALVLAIGLEWLDRRGPVACAARTGVVPAVVSLLFAAVLLREGHHGAAAVGLACGMALLAMARFSRPSAPAG